MKNNETSANKFLEITKKYGAPIANFTKAIGPFLISQSDKLSEQYAKHLARLASVDAMKEVIVDEQKLLNSVKAKALERIIDSGDELERVRLQGDIQRIKESGKVLSVGAQALPYFKNIQMEADTDTDLNIMDSWLDRFNEFAKLSNEPWREDLLARALAKEAELPGTVSPKALWVIGTLEEDVFHAFSALLDISIHVGDALLIPDGQKPAIEHVIPECALGKNKTVGVLAYMLGDAGLLSNPELTANSFSVGSVTHAEYGTEKYSIKCKDADLVVKGILYTPLGNSIGSFCKVKGIDIGHVILNDWIESLHKVHYEVNKLS